MCNISLTLHQAACLRNKCQDGNTNTPYLMSSTHWSFHCGRSGYRWQTDVSKNVCVEWTGRFFNSEIRHNNWLLPVLADTGRDIRGEYDQRSGLLPVTGTDSVTGVITFQVTSCTQWQQQLVGNCIHTLTKIHTLGNVLSSDLFSDSWLHGSSRNE